MLLQNLTCKVVANVDVFVASIYRRVVSERNGGLIVNMHQGWFVGIGNKSKPFQK